MTRENFSPKVRAQIAESAGHQCSFPGCNRRTEGPGSTATTTARSGYAAHIYAAAEGGPRGQGGLTPSVLRGPGNGIWLCGRHAKIVDNNRGVAYPPETLLSYKALHEARVLLEHEGLYPPIGWLHEITIVQSPLFSGTQKFQLAKLNLIYGMNSTGKTAITEWIAGFFDCRELARWLPTHQDPLDVRLSLLNPKLQNLSLLVDGTDVKYSIDTKSVAFVPVGFRVLKPDQLDYSIKDDLQMLSEALRLPSPVVLSLIDEVNRFPYAKMSNLRFEKDGDGPYEFRADVHGTRPGLSVRSLSCRECERVIIELATAAARLSGKYCPTLLILDSVSTIIFEGFFEFYSRHLLDPLNQFQTLMCVPENDLDLDNVEWNGWQVIRTEGKPPNVQISQKVHTKDA